ncbi:hypothetical protein AMK22_11640 [Streptomyces sp. CB01580]|nr:hypothetical protein AMK22_11640 [Streptomyces sp. CB01580]
MRMVVLTVGAVARRSCFETQDRVGLTEAELIDVEVEELPLLQVGDVDAIVRLLDLQTGGCATTAARSTCLAKWFAASPTAAFHIPL